MTKQQWGFSPTLVYSFLTVALPPSPVEHNDWTPLHGQQGFSWQPGTVSFGTIDSDGKPLASVEVRDEYLLRNVSSDEWVRRFLSEAFDREVTTLYTVAQRLKIFVEVERHPNWHW